MIILTIDWDLGGGLIDLGFFFFFFCLPYVVVIIKGVPLCILWLRHFNLALYQKRDNTHLIMYIL